MKNLKIIGAIVGLLLLSVIAGVYAHGSEGIREMDWRYMDEMHNSMVKIIKDPELRNTMNDMHKNMGPYMERYSRGQMMGWMGMM